MSAETPAKTIRSRYTKPCARCGASVPATTGIAQLHVEDDGKRVWVTRHGKIDPDGGVFSGQAACDAATGTSTPTIPKPAEPTPTPKDRHPLTDEQQLVVTDFRAGVSGATQAGAGSGKTSTCVACAETTTLMGTFTAFNKGIVMDAAAKLPKNVKARTVHSLAFGQVGKHYSHRMDEGKRQSGSAMARQLGLRTPFVCQVGEETRVIQPKQQASYVMKAVKNFCQSADKHPSVKHFSLVAGIDLPTDDGERTYANNDALAAHLSDALEAAWEDIQDTSGTLRFEHYHYVKMWELGVRGKPVIPGEFVMVDEAQDMNPVMLSAILQQDKQTLFVGDSQQAINEWMGAIDAMAQVPAERTRYLTNSFRFGPEIAAVANAILASIEGAELRLTGKGKPGTVGPTETPDCILTRTNAGAIIAMLGELEAGRTPYLVGGGTQIVEFAQGAKDLMEGRRTEHPELAIFASWGEVLRYVESDILGDELKPMVKLIEDHGVDTIIKVAGNETAEEDADVVVSTAHKSKGREWDSVQLAGDFFPLERMDVGEYRLLYVACTRARRHLDIEGCPPALAVVYPERTKAEATR
jgi:hypothetical protein